MNMKSAKVTAALIVLLATVVFAQDQTDPEMAARVAAAQAKLNAKAQSAATQTAPNDYPSLGASSATADKTDAAKDRFAKQRRAREEEIRKEIAEERKAKANEKGESLTFGGDRDENIKKLEAEQKLIKEHPTEWIPAVEDEVGSVGSFPEEIEVAQIIDKTDLLAHRIDWSDGEPRTAKQFIWIAGVDTSKLFDGKPVQLKGIFTVTGNKTYKTAGGSTLTVLVFQAEGGAAPAEKPPAKKKSSKSKK